VGDLHISRPSLLEVGEDSLLALRTADTSGVTSCVDKEAWIVSSDAPNVVEASGFRLRAMAPGNVTIRVRPCTEPDAEGRSWTVQVIDRQLNSSIHLFNRPRILFTDRELQEFRKRIQDTSPIGENFLATDRPAIHFPQLWKSMLNTADNYVQEERFEVKYPSVTMTMLVELPLTEPKTIPNPAGYVDYPFWTMFSRAVEERLTVLSTAYMVTGETVYADKAKMYLLALTEFSKWYEFDHRGAEGNLSNAHLVIGAASAYDALYGYLTAEEREIAAKALLYRGLQPLAIDLGNRDMHNIVAAKQVAMMYGAAALHGDCAFADKYLQQAYDYILSYLDRKLVSSETEGLLYDNVAARHVWMAADLYRRATGDATLCNHPYLKEELPERFFRFLSAGNTNTFPNLADSFLKLDVSYMMTMLASHHAHPAAMWYVEKFEADKTSVLMNLRGIPSAIGPDVFYKERPSQVFGTIGWAALRTGWGANDHLLAFTSSGSARDHTHKDQNNLMLNVAGEWLLTNPGYQDYVPGPRADYTVGTVGHNSLLINGQGQSARGGGFIAKAWMTSCFEAVQGDASASYEGALKAYRRSILHINKSCFLVWDEVETNTVDDSPQLLFHTASVNRFCQLDKVLSAGDKVTTNTVTIRGEKEDVKLQVLFPPDAQMDITEYPGAETYGPYAAIREQASKSTRKQFVTLLAPSSTNSTDIKAEGKELAEGVLGVTLAFGEGNDALILSADERITVSFDGNRFQGKALWMHRNSSKLAAWEAQHLHIEGRLTLQAEIPMNITYDASSGELAVHHYGQEAAALTWTIHGQSSRTWTLSPGEHRLHRVEGVND
jgi:hypothetical protein